MSAPVHRTDHGSGDCSGVAAYDAVPTPPGRAASITACPDGPLLVRGDVALLDSDGRPIDAGRRTVALCRCGGSSIKPWCDGTHKVNGFSSSG